MSIQYEKLERCYEYYRSIADFHPRVGLILGSGLGGYAKNMHVEKEIPYREIPDFPVSTVQGHDGRFLLGWIGKVPVVVMKGRVHYYEGYSMEEVVLPVRLMKKMGIEILFLTNASGGINPEFAAGDFMMIRDQIASFVPSPLIGQNIEKLGTRFPDMTHIYDEELQLRTIQSRIARLKEIETMSEDGTFDVLPKKEVIALKKEWDKLEKNLGGIKDMKRIPDAIFIVDPKKERICVQEAQSLGITLIGIADTNCDPDELDYVIPGNDDAIRAVKLIVSKMADAVIEAKQGTEEVAAEAAEETVEE